MQVCCGTRLPAVPGRSSGLRLTSAINPLDTHTQQGRLPSQTAWGEHINVHVCMRMCMCMYVCTTSAHVPIYSQLMHLRSALAVCAMPWQRVHMASHVARVNNMSTVLSALWQFPCATLPATGLLVASPTSNGVLKQRCLKRSTALFITVTVCG